MANKGTQNAKSHLEMPLDEAELTDFIKGIQRVNIAKAEESKEQANRRKINPKLVSKWSKRIKEIMNKYESCVWNLPDLKKDIESIKTLEEEADSLIKIHEKNQSNLTEEDKKDFQNIQKFLKKLPRKRELLEQKYAEHSSSFALKLMEEKKFLLESLNTREGVTKSILQIFQQIELAKYQLTYETKLRNQLEIIFELEISELNRLIMEEARARCELEQQLEHAVQIKKNIWGNLELLQGNLRMMLENFEQLLEAKEEERRNLLCVPSHTFDLINLLSSAQGIDNQLSSLVSMIEYSDEDILVVPSSDIVLVEKLTKQITNDVAIRKEEEKKHLALQDLVATLKNQVAEEKAARESNNISN